MLANQSLVNSRLHLITGLAVVLGTLAGCAAWQASSGEGRAGGGSMPERDASATVVTAERSPTATEVAAARAGETRPAPVITSEAINSTAPATYTVKRGDTLWDISALFLKDPWLWPEIWQVNPQVVNPHLIYPGDVLALVYGKDGRPAVMLQQSGAARLDPMLRSSPLDGAIATIPYSAIAAFLERPSVVSEEQINRAPRIVALRDSHLIGGSGLLAYVQGLDRSAAIGGRYSVVHVGAKIVDPDGGGVLGYQGIFAATAVLTAEGRPATVILTDSARETLVGDRLLQPDMDVPLNFIPRAPRGDIRGRIISVMEGVKLIGQYRIVAINRGKRHGLESGHVLAIDEVGETVRDRSAGGVAGMTLGGAFAPKVKLPNERVGALLVFKVYDRMSYGLVVDAQRPIRIYDVVRSP